MGLIRFAVFAFVGFSALSARSASPPSVYPSAAEIEQRNATARRSGAIVYYSITPEQVQDLSRLAVAGAVGADKQKLSKLADKIGVSAEATLSLLRVVGSVNLATDRLPQKLAEVVDRYRRTEEQLVGFHTGNDVADRFVEQAQAALVAGDLIRTHRLFADAKKDLIKAGEQAHAPRQRVLAGTAAWISGVEGYLAETELHYAEAANFFDQAANLISGGSAHLSYLVAKAEALYLQGKECNDNSALTASIDLRRKLLEKRWVTNVDIGDALEVLGEHESGTARLEDAVAEYRLALTGLTKPIERFLRARAQVKLGTALVELGRREHRTAPLEDAIVAYRGSLTVLTKDEVPIEWARTQYDLGVALELLSEQESGMVFLEEAVSAYRAAQTELTQERAPTDWKRAQQKLTTALELLGKPVVQPR